MSVAKAGKRPLRSLTAHEKLDAIRRVHDGESKASVARDIGVPESTLRGWCKNEDKISYLSRQSSPETDGGDSVHGIDSSNKEKKMKLVVEENLPFNLSLKPPRGASYSPPSSSSASAVDYNKTTSAAAASVVVVENDTPKTDKFALNLNTKPETPKSTTQMSERERNRAELARLSVELGLNRPEMFLSNANTGNTLADLSTNIGLLAQWNTLLLQQQQQPPPAPSTTKHSTTTTKNINHVSSSSASASSLLTYAKPEHQQKPPKLAKIEPAKSIEDSVWYWLKTQQAALGLNNNQNPTSPIPTSSQQNGCGGVSTSPPNGSSEQHNSSWFWKWYKQFAHTQAAVITTTTTAPQLQQQSPPEKPILYQQLTKDKDSENFQAEENNKPKTSGGNKARAVLDNLLLNNNNNNNVAPSNRKDLNEEDLSQGEALEHGEKFLKWLECCSEPSVSAVQIMQFKSLLNNIKNGADRKNGDHNKAKVKRK